MWASGSPQHNLAGMRGGVSVGGTALADHNWKAYAA